MDLKEFDPKDQYRDVVELVDSVAHGGQVQVYRVHHGQTRAEYYVVALEKAQSRLVGIRAKAVES